MHCLPEATAKFQSQALAAEQNGQWIQEWLKLAKDRRLFHLAVPKKYGGHQLPLPELLKILEQASFLDGSFGWTLTLGAGAGVFAAFMHPHFANQQFTRPNTFITGSGYPAGTARKEDQGFIASGQWKYATGAPHATLFTASCVLNNIHEADMENKSIRVLTFYPGEVIIKSKWNSYGLKATASHDFSVEDIAVPSERTFALKPDELIIDEPLYRFPFQTFAECTLAASLAGITRHFLNETSFLLRSKSNHTEEREQLLGQSIEAVNTAWQQLQNCTGDTWKSCMRGKKVSREQQNKISKAARSMAGVSLSQAQKLYPYCGMAILDEDSDINRAWRDLHTASQHMLLTPSLK